MKTVSSQFYKVLSNAALTVTKINVNSWCFTHGYQPMMPKCSDKLKKNI